MLGWCARRADDRANSGVRRRNRDYGRRQGGGTNGRRSSECHRRRLLDAIRLRKRYERRGSCLSRSPVEAVAGFRVTDASEVSKYAVEWPGYVAKIERIDE
jgi:hypothetical protein